MQLIILGMHRSGTSMQTRLLNLAGAYFGPEGSNTGASEENPKGFWERRDVRALNDGLLHSTGCDWDRAVDFDVAKVSGKALDHFNNAASRLLLDMDGHRPWVLKEPRLCLLLPIWRPLLESPVGVHVLRHPVEVASSLFRRNGMPIEVGLVLWKLYVSTAVSASRGMPGVISFHQDVVSDPHDAMYEMIEHLQEVGVGGLRLPSRREVEAFVSRDFYRERLSQLDFDPRLAAPQVELFEEIRRTRALPEESSLTPEEAALLRRYESGLPPLKGSTTAKGRAVTGAEKTIMDLNDSLTRVNEAVLRRDGRIKDLDAKLAAQADNLGSARQELNDTRAELKGLRAELASRTENLEQACQELSDTRGTLKGLRAELAVRTEDLDQARLELSDTHGTLKDLRAELAARNDNLTQARQELRDVHLAMEDLKVEHATLTIKIERADAKAAKATRDSGCKTQEITRLTRLLMTRERQLQERESQADALKAAAKAARDQVAAQAADIQALQNQLNTSAQRYRAQIDALNAQLARVRRSLGWKLSAPLRWGKRRVAARRSIGTHGDARLVLQSGLFDRAWYARTYPDVAESGIDPVEHYLMHGADEGRNPGPAFNTMRYLEKYPDVGGSGMNPLLHFIRHGRSEGRLPL